MSLRYALDRMPQKGAMLLLEAILEIDETSVTCRARDHRAPDYPLRIDGRLMGISLIELGAQAAAAHASLHGIGSSHAGLLLALYDVEVLLADGDAAVGRFAARAERLYLHDGTARYRFTVRDEAEERLRGEAMLRMQAVRP